MDDYERGQWQAYTRILNLLNAYDSKTVPKRELYKTIFTLRPEEDWREERLRAT